ncbi:MAG: dihydropteroate synthase, partial [Chloroflexota bacterium]
MPILPLRAGPFELVWGRRTYVMGIVNVSPDSFAGDALSTSREAIDQGLRFVAEGADLLDVGGESTRPGGSPVAPDAEIRRVVPVIEGLSAASVPISVDTSKAVVARAALAAGACLVNDVTGLLGDPAIAGVVAEARAGAVAMANHRLALPTGAARRTIVDRTLARWAASLQIADRAGLPRAQVILDPGLGFGLRPASSLALLRHLPDLRRLGHPLLVGPSRKGFIGEALGGLPVEERLEGTLAAVALAIADGAD